MDYHRHYKLKIKIVRIFNTYGPNMAIDDGRVISNFITQAISGKDLSINGQGSQTRSFQYIDDLISGLIMMMNSDDSVIGPINIGNPFEISIINLATKILELTNSKSKIKFNGLPQDDPKMRKPEISLAKEFLKWQPEINLEAGLIKTIKYFQNNDKQ